jgi:hypothetical protein
MTSWFTGIIAKQLPGLIEKYEGPIEESLKTSLEDAKKNHPEEAKLFLDNCRKLNKVVEQTLLAPNPEHEKTAGRRPKRRSVKKRTIKR